MPGWVRAVRAKGDAEGDHRQAQWHDGWAARRPYVRARFTELGLDIASDGQRTPEWLAAFHKTEIEKWWPIIKAANIKGG